MQNIYFVSWNANMNLNSRITIWDHPFRYALINMYEYIFTNMENKSYDIMNPVDFWLNTHLIDIMAAMFTSTASSRGRFYNEGGVASAPLLDETQVSALCHVTNLINYKILYTIYTDLDEPAGLAYGFFGTFTQFSPNPFINRALSGNYPMFKEQAEKAGIPLPSDRLCPCF